MTTLNLFDRSTFLETKIPTLRPYQAAGIQALRDRVRDGKRRILLVGPTGMGKMLLVASIIRTSTVPVVFVCHRMELIDQAAEQLARLGITNFGVIRGDDDRVNASASVQLCSIQTLARRDKPEAGIILIDEAHRAVSDSYLTLLDHYKNSIVLGFTATPTRYDGRPLGSLFECLEVVCTYQQLIKSGYISEPLCYAPVTPDLSGVQIVGGDFDEDQLGGVMQELIGNLVEHWLRLAHMHPSENSEQLVEGPRRRTFIFAVNINHSLEICSKFEAAGARIAHLDGNTSETERRRIVKALGSGDLDAVTNVGVLLEGVDVPSAKCVVHARPTQSLVLWRQSCGRMLRPWNKMTPLLLDHAGNIARLGFPHEDLHWSLKERAQRSANKPKTRICSGCYAYLPAYRRLCPYCSTEAPPPEDPEFPTETNEQLRSLQTFATTPEAMRRLYFDTMVRLARQKGYRPGFASARYKEKYGGWPPWDWSEMVKASFASDPEWQTNYAKHVSEKAARR